MSLKYEPSSEPMHISVTKPDTLGQVVSQNLDQSYAHLAKLAASDQALTAAFSTEVR